MDKAVKRPSDMGVPDPASTKAKADSRSPGQGSKAAAIGGAWVREDGAICFGNECVVIHNENGQTFLDVDQTACGIETGKLIVDKLMDGFSDGGPINIRVKPNKELERTPGSEQP